MRRSRPTCPSSRTGRWADNRPSVSLEVVDLLRHTAGLTYPEEGDTPGHRRFDSIVFRRNLTLADLVTSLSSIPLLHRAGRGLGIQSGRRCAGAHRRGRFGPAVRSVPGGTDLQAARHGRHRLLRAAGQARRASSIRIPGGRPPLWDISKPTKLFSGGGGLASTAPDYLRFCEMLLNGGTLDGVRILSPATVKQMTTNTLPPETRFAGELGQYVGPRVGTGWGLGFAIRTNPEFSLIPGAVGSYNWSGSGGPISGSTRSRDWRWSS